MSPYMTYLRVRLWNDYPESLGNIANLNQLKADKFHIL